jgi:hypothetical protein
MKRSWKAGLLVVLVSAAIISTTAFTQEGVGDVDCQKIGCTGPHKCWDTTSWNSEGCSLECVYGTIHQFRMCTPA